VTQATTIVTAAFRESNLIPIGQTPTSAEQTEGLELLNRLVQGMYGHEMGEELRDWNLPAPQRTAPVAANYPQLPYPQGLDADLLTTPFAFDPTQDVFLYPPANTRILWGQVTVKAFFPEAPQDGSRMGLVQASGAGDGGVGGAVLTLDGNGRTIQTSNTKTYSAPVTASQWLYRADLGDWVLVADMVLTDQMPFPSELDDLWICMLAIRMAPRFGKVVAKETELVATSMLKKFKARYRQAANTTYNSSDIPRSLQSTISGRWFW